MAVQHHLGAVKVRINYMHLNLSVTPFKVKKSALQFVLWLQVSPHMGLQGAHGIDDNILGILRLENWMLPGDSTPGKFFYLLPGMELFVWMYSSGCILCVTCFNLDLTFPSFQAEASAPFHQQCNMLAVLQDWASLVFPPIPPSGRPTGCLQH